MEELTPLRQQIDGIDDEILRLLNRRAELALEIGHIKKSRKAPLHVPEREQAILGRLMKNNPGPFPAEAVRHIFREIISASLNLESPVTVAYLGPAATFSHLAAMRHFGASSTYLPQGGIPDVITAVEKGNAQFGVMPVENSVEGSIAVTLDALAESDLVICAEVIERIHHYLLAKTPDLGAIRRVYSHPQPLAQCRLWLQGHLPGVQVLPTASTAAASEQAANEPGSAAIAPELAAKVYGLSVLAQKIEDSATNQTRFWVVTRTARPPAAGPHKTSLLFSVKDEVGSLTAVLAAFETHGINLARIESRPSRLRPWEYLFHVDILAGPDDRDFRAALDEVRSRCMWLKVLGTYRAVNQG